MQTTAQPTEADVKAAKERVIFLRDRLQTLQAEQEKLKGKRETTQERILEAYVEGREPDKEKAEAARDSERLRFITDAIMLCKKQLAESEGVASYEERLNYEKQVKDFRRQLIGFIDGDLSALLKRYQPLEAAYWKLINQGNVFPDLYPAPEKQIFEILYYVFSKDCVPQDLGFVEKRFAGLFETARKAK